MCHMVYVHIYIYIVYIYYVWGQNAATKTKQVYIYTYINEQKQISLSLSLYIRICIYIYMYLCMYGLAHDVETFIFWILEMFRNDQRAPLGPWCISACWAACCAHYMTKNEHTGVPIWAVLPIWAVWRTHVLIQCCSRMSHGASYLSNHGVTHEEIT